MGTSLDIKIKRANKVYHAGDLNLPPDQEAGTGMQTGHQHLQTGVQEVLSGVVVISGKDSIQHQGVSLTVEGSVNLQLSAKSVGVFEAFYNSVKPIQIISSTIEMVKPGKFPSGKTEIPFEFPLHVKGNKVLYETYHGVFVNIQRSSPAPPLGALLSLTVLTPLTCGSLFHLDRSLAVGQDHDKYTLRCDMRRSLLAKDLTKTCEFIVHSAQRASNFVMENEPKFSSLPRAGPEARTPLGPQPRTHSAVTTAEPPPGQLRPQKGKLTPSPVDFTITPETLQNVKEFIFCAAGVPPRVILSEQARKSQHLPILSILEFQSPCRILVFNQSVCLPSFLQLCELLSVFLRCVTGEPWPGLSAHSFALCLVCRPTVDMFPSATA
ncbi:vacuolar protein sorting-associated protein 26C isoform X10 [Ailuropoda melanoleuca]|uniref:vacuolar protein sorting-associated protein 26C isoform X10 n=1 Tax=Ailuropoda melanoleuca TaxID=9646 RepID=UPI00149433F2|nr:vacuolar protein sorting-associated protein 26C isoform X10 [Ailuropoda melanoleuca]